MNSLTQKMKKIAGFLVLTLALSGFAAPAHWAEQEGAAYPLTATAGSGASYACVAAGSGAMTIGACAGADGTGAEAVTEAKFGAAGDESAQADAPSATA